MMLNSIHMRLLVKGTPACHVPHSSFMNSPGDTLKTLKLSFICSGGVVGGATAMYHGSIPRHPKHCVTLAWWVILRNWRPVLLSLITYNLLHNRLIQKYPLCFAMWTIGQVCPELSNDWLAPGFIYHVHCKNLPQLNLGIIYWSSATPRAEKYLTCNHNDTCLGVPLCKASWASSSSNAFPSSTGPTTLTQTGPLSLPQIYSRSPLFYSPTQDSPARMLWNRPSLRAQGVAWQSAAPPYRWSPHLPWCQQHTLLFRKQGVGNRCSLFWCIISRLVISRNNRSIIPPML